jgi:hypothetical protein
MEYRLFQFHLAIPFLSLAWDNWLQKPAQQVCPDRSRRKVEGEFEPRNSGAAGNAWGWGKGWLLPTGALQQVAAGKALTETAQCPLTALLERDALLGPSSGVCP